MSKVQDPPIAEKMTETNGKPKLAWIVWFESLIRGDTGTNWSPSVTSLTVVGVPTITGNYYENEGFTDFWIKVTPSTSTTATAGTTYFDLPFDVTIDGGCIAVGGLLGGGTGMVDAATNRCYPPSWTGVTVPVTVTGRVRTL